jgi:mannose-6-phosphate isomerase-like protein (cupin superfamily)
LVKAVDINAVLKGLPVLRGREPATTEDEAAAAFARLGELGGASIFTGSFEGESPWERHSMGDELVQVIAGATRLTILTDSDTHVLEMTAGMLTVVPQGCWHKFNAPGGVSVLTATPQPTDHSDSEDPRKAD